jgi:hypothetical protein
MGRCASARPATRTCVSFDTRWSWPAGGATQLSVPFGPYGEMRMTAMDFVGLLLLLFLVVPLVTARPSRY